MSLRQPPVDGKPATLFVALELSKSTWLVAIHSPTADKLSQHRLSGGDAAGLAMLIEHKRREAQAALSRPVRAMSCYEAGYDGFWLHRFLCDLTIDNRVLDPTSIPVDRCFRRGKTDRLDVTALLRTLMALARGEPRVCREVRVPSVEQEDDRRRSRERARLVNERGQHLNCIKSLLMTQGVREFAATRRGWRNRLEELRTAAGEKLAPYLKKEIERECRRLWLVIEMIAEIEAEQKEVAKVSATEGPAAQLSSLRGVDATTANVLADEVFFRDIKNRRELARYFGLVSSPWSSGAVNRDQALAGSGNPRARRPAIELAWLWLRHQPDSALVRWFHERVGAGGKRRLRETMIAALARKLMVAFLRFLTLGEVPQGAVVKA